MERSGSFLPPTWHRRFPSFMQITSMKIVQLNILLEGSRRFWTPRQHLSLSPSTLRRFFFVYHPPHISIAVKNRQVEHPCGRFEKVLDAASATLALSLRTSALPCITPFGRFGPRRFDRNSAFVHRLVRAHDLWILRLREKSDGQTDIGRLEWRTRGDDREGGARIARARGAPRTDDGQSVKKV